MSEYMPVTTNGPEVENFIQDDLERHGYNVESQVQSSGINKGWSRIDLVLVEENEAISLKYQGVEGTAEEKLLYEAENLSLMCHAHGYTRGTIVLCGDGWSECKYWWFLNEYQPPTNVRIISYDQYKEEYTHD